MLNWFHPFEIEEFENDKDVMEVLYKLWKGAERKPELEVFIADIKKKQRFIDSYIEEHEQDIIDNISVPTSVRKISREHYQYKRIEEVAEKIRKEFDFGGIYWEDEVADGTPFCIDCTSSLIHYILIRLMKLGEYTKEKYYYFTGNMHREYIDSNRKLVLDSTKQQIEEKGL